MELLIRVVTIVFKHSIIKKLSSFPGLNVVLKFFVRPLVIIRDICVNVLEIYQGFRRHLDIRDLLAFLFR